MSLQQGDRPLTSTERGRKYAAKLAKFGIKRIYIRPSISEQKLIEAMCKKLEFDSRDEMILTVLRERAATLDIYLSDFVEANNNDYSKFE